jgi:hypothetical protein
MEVELISGNEAFAQTVTRLVADASRELALLSVKLEPRLYGHPQILEAMQKFALENERNRVRILIADSRAAVAISSPLLDLARKLPSRFDLRELAEEQRGVVNSERLLVDGASQMLERLSPDQPDASYYAHPSTRTLQRLKEFNVLWDISQPSLNLSGLR